MREKSLPVREGPPAQVPTVLWGDMADIHLPAHHRPTADQVSPHIQAEAHFDTPECDYFLERICVASCKTTQCDWCNGSLNTNYVPTPLNKVLHSEIETLI